MYISVYNYVSCYVYKKRLKIYVLVDLYLHRSTDAYVYVNFHRKGEKGWYIILTATEMVTKCVSDVFMMGLFLQKLSGFLFFPSDRFARLRICVSIVINIFQNYFIDFKGPLNIVC